MNRRTTNNNGSRSGRGFTLVEMLVILGVIAVILAIALPAFTAITGSRSVEAGRNILSASIGRARAEAIRRGVTVGAYVFVDAEGRTNVAFVALADGETDPDPYDEYKPYALFINGGTTDYQGKTSDPLIEVDGEPSMTSDRVLALSADFNSTDETMSGDYNGYQGRPVVLNLETQNMEESVPTAPTFTPVVGVDGNRAQERPVIGGDSSAEFPFTNLTWATNSEFSGLTLLSDIPVERLPANVGVQVITGSALLNADDADGAMIPPTQAVDVNFDGITDYRDQFVERYTRTGMVAFDRKGRLVGGQSFAITANSPLGQRMGLAAGGYTLGTTGFGVVLYDMDAFESGGSDGTATHWKGSGDNDFFNTVAADDEITEFFTPTEFDLTNFYPVFDPAGELATIFNEYAEERWLDANTTPLLVNRFSGTLVDNLGEQP